MYAMQYEIPLPADYDMAIIRHRVATKGPLLDTMPGLGLKAYLIRERGKDDSPVNLYAPFYLWASIEGMNSFLWGGGGFGGIVASFGRPAVQHWTGVACAMGPGAQSMPTRATRLIEPFAPDVDPACVVDLAKDEMARRARQPGVYATAIVVDPHNWNVVHFTLWTDIAMDVPGIRYEVLHLSAPHLQEIMPARSVEVG
jgi:Domain of unknown function (DUF4865)